MRAVPFAFEDFAPKPPPPAAALAPAPEGLAAEERFSRADLDEAFAAGRAAGREEADGREENADDLAAVIAERLLAEIARLRQDAADDRERHREGVVAFLKGLCRRLGFERADRLALSLVDRLLAVSDDRTPAGLFVSEETFERFGSALCAELAARGVSEVITVASDSALSGGECRLAWRGGAASVALSTIDAEVERILRGDA
jgi:flagellar biosynthesis/type III secretory pathway protein FliH